MFSNTGCGISQKPKCLAHAKPPGQVWLCAVKHKFWRSRFPPASVRRGASLTSRLNDEAPGPCASSLPASAHTSPFRLEVCHLCFSEDLLDQARLSSTALPCAASAAVSRLSAALRSACRPAKSSSKKSFLRQAGVSTGGLRRESRACWSSAEGVRTGQMLVRGWAAGQGWWCQAARDLLHARRCRESIPCSWQRGVLPTVQLGVATHEDIGEVGAAGTGEVLAASEMVQTLCQGG
jgi:hypothetical protein